MDTITFALLIIALGALIAGAALIALFRRSRQCSKNGPGSDDSSVFIGSLGPTDTSSSGHHHGGDSGSDGGGGHGGH